MKTCIYCNKQKENTEFSDEHILPAALGGNLEPVNPFSTDLVCEKCNNISGFFIDAPFIKNWLINLNRANHLKKYIPITSTTILPLKYIGIINDLTYQDKICEFYVGPTGDFIYHFHDKYPEEPNVHPMVGLPPHLKNTNIDHGFVFLFIRSNNPDWHPTIIHSLIENFKKSTLYLGNVTNTIDKFQDIPSNLSELHNNLIDIQDTEHKASININIHSGNRFLAKLALGIGCILLKEEFKKSDDAGLLRKFMWTKEDKLREEIPVRGSGILSDLKELNEIMSFESAHILNIMEVGSDLSLYINFYGSTGSVIKISGNKDHWEPMPFGGIIYVIVPHKQKCIGPLRLGQLIAHKSGNKINSDLKELEDELKNPIPWPPYDI